MAKQRTEYKNCDICKTNILQYIYVYIRIQYLRIASYRQQASNGAQTEGPRPAALDDSSIGNLGGLRRSCKSSLA